MYYGSTQFSLNSISLPKQLIVDGFRLTLALVQSKMGKSPLFTLLLLSLFSFTNCPVFFSFFFVYLGKKEKNIVLETPALDL